MINLGKIKKIFTLTPLYLYIIVLFHSELSGAALILRAPEHATIGQEYQFEISAQGQGIEFYQLFEIGDISVSQISSSKSFAMNDGEKEDVIKKRYALIAYDDFTIPPIKVKINGVDVYTKEQKVSIQNPKKTVSDKFDLSVSADKQQVYIGEQINYTVKFKYRNDVQISDLQFVSAEFTDFWSKTIDDNTKIYKEGGYNIQELSFILFAQKSGKLEIKPSRINISIMSEYDPDSIFNAPNTITDVYSNALSFDVKPLPDNVQLIGDFEVTTSVNKTLIDRGEAVSFIVKVKGKGNIDDMPSIDLHIPDATVYKNPAERNFFIEEGVYAGEYSKSFSILSERDFTIPSLSLRYYEPRKNILKELNTKPYAIKVSAHQAHTSMLHVQKNKTQETQKSQQTKDEKHSTPPPVTPAEFQDKQKLFYFTLGMTAAFLVWLVLKLTGTHSGSSSAALKNIQKAKNFHELLSLLLPYLNQDKTLDAIIFEIEKVVYKKSDEKISLRKTKKDILKLLKQLKEKKNEKDIFYANSHF
jgi:hypothetical protein